MCALFPVHTILPSSITVRAAGEYAAARGCRLYITRRGQTIASPVRMPGWIPFAVPVRHGRAA